MNTKTKQAVSSGAAFLVLLVSLVMPACKPKEPPQAPPPQEKPNDPDHTAPTPHHADSSIHLTMGNPSDATDDQKNADNYLMRKPYFALSYNDSKGTANWVSWCLRETDFGHADRGDFYPDAEIPKGFRRATPHDYTSSGFDRGHLCPRSDRTATKEMANATFVMSNIVPQSPHLNQRGWADLEDFCRSLVKKKHTLYIVAGVQGVGGEGSSGKAETIAGGRLTVPAKCWKVVLVVENGTGGADDVSKVGAHTRTIAVVMPNDQSIGHDWPKYRTSVKEIETLTGYKLFDRVPAAVIDPIKAKTDHTHIPPVGKTRPGE